MSQLVDLSRLPPPDVLEPVNFDTLLAERKAALIAQFSEDQRDAVRRTLELESEPLTKIARENAYREMLLRQRINEAALATMLAYAEGPDLDQIGARYKVARLELVPADLDAVPPVPAVMEGDDDYRERIQEAFDGLSVAGPKAGYRKFAREADPRVADVAVTSPAPAEVVITVLSREGDGTASPDLLDKVRAYLSDEDRRPVADRLTVQSASIINYRADAVLYLYPGPEAEPIKLAAEKALAAQVNQRRRLGQDIRLTKLTAVVHVEGVQRIELPAPAADLVLDDHQAGYCTGYSVKIGGTDE
ncbi:baseplate J/gp47 family protein [Crenobacter sp. SG2305]|uniref:baseplate J/gp47 family protein n=1 Tax=Crenobacter oryzisoli TaxID=3056844 RepID=UPI0025AB1888|nr:baseplate J/gp47 family protein [Crenobacter sp. SG2305]MDN0081613.1 baseplate J/gp47 family protein [Crenobacter sp. SG2305]